MLDLGLMLQQATSPWFWQRNFNSDFRKIRYALASLPVGGTSVIVLHSQFVRRQHLKTLHSSAMTSQNYTVDHPAETGPTSAKSPDWVASSQKKSEKKSKTNSMYTCMYGVSLWFSGLYSLHKTPQWRDLSPPRPPLVPSSCPLAVTFTRSCLVFPQSRSAVTALPPLLPPPPPAPSPPEARRLDRVHGGPGKPLRPACTLVRKGGCVERRWAAEGDDKNAEKKATTE